eukprot:514702-Amphidinium_carterae.2
MSGSIGAGMSVTEDAVNADSGEANPWMQLLTRNTPASEVSVDAVAAQPLFQLGTSRGSQGQGIKKRKGRPRQCVKDLEEALSAKRSQAIGSAAALPSMSHSSAQGQMTATGSSIMQCPMPQDIATTAVFEVPDAATTCMYAPKLAITPLLQSCLARATDEAVLDKSTLTLATRFLESPDFHLGSKVVLQELMQMDRKGISLRLHRLASSVYVTHRHERQQVEESIVTSMRPDCCVAYFDLCSYDETPMLTRVKDRRHSIPDVDIHGADRLDSQALESLQKVLASVQISGSAKLLQVQTGFGMLLRAMQQPVLVSGPTLNPVLPLARGTGQGLLQALACVSAVGRVSTNFKLQVRGTVLDKGNANGVAERGIAALRGPSWKAVALDCQAHIISTIFKKTFDGLMQSHVSGLVQLALSVVETGKFSIWRRALVAEIDSRKVVFIQGPLQDDAQAYKDLVMELFIDRGNNPLSNRVLLESLNTGDWRAQEFQIVLEAGCTIPSVEHVKAMLKNILPSILASKQMTLFPRHRWTGSEEAISEVLLLDMMFHLLRPTFQRFLALLGDVYQESEPCSATDVIMDAVPSGEGASTHDLQQVPDAASAYDVSGADPAATSAASRAELNARNRRLAKAWLATDVVAPLTLMKLVAIPLTDLLHKQLKIAGVEFEEEERCKVAEKLLSSGASMEDRTSPLILACDQVFEKEFLEQLQSLLQRDAVWNRLVPPTSSTIACKGLAHRMLSRAGAGVHELLALPHQAFPTKTYRLIREPEFAATIRAEGSCVKDKFTLALESMPGGLCSAEVRQVLMSHAHMQRTDISAIECKHASIRRTTLSRSLQTWRYGLEATSADFLLQSCRRLVHTSSAPRKVIKKIKNKKVCMESKTSTPMCCVAKS